MVDDRTVLESIHTEIHALRLIQGYKPTPFEFKMANIIAERFAVKCNDCRLKLEQYKVTPIQNKKPGIMNRLKNAMEDTE